MPTKIMLTNRGAAPVVICDVCGAWIQRAEEGCYAWTQGQTEAGTLREVAFLHTGECFIRYEAKHGPFVADMPLNVFLPYLAVNLDVDWESAVRMATYFGTP